MIQPSDSTDVHPARDSASPPVALPQRERSNANEEIATSVVHAYKYPAHRAPRVAADTWASRENVDMGHSFVREPPGYHVTARVQGLDSPPAMSPPLRPRCTSRTAPETEEARTPDSSTRDLLPSTRHRVNAGLDMDECMALMMGQGWCSHQVNYLSQIHNTAVMRQFAAMDRRNERPEDHRPCLQQDHCVAYNSPLTQEYRTKHAQPCGEETCYTVQVPHRALIQVLKSGGVPLLSIHQGLTGALSFKVHRRQYWSKYVSVSHIWADGLGNLTENGLPACQVRRLLWDLQVMASRNLSGLLSYDNNVWQGLGDEQTAIYVKEMVKPLFWMDTLCIPVQPELRDLKERCIGKMASIYARSLFVLVLDKELMGVEWGQNQDWPEAWPDPWHFAYLIAASAWMCRNWTLQEAVLSQRPVFKCKDALFYLDHRWITQAERSLHAEQSGLFKVLWYDLLGARRPGTSAFEPTKSEDLETLTRAWNRLVGRSTTEAADLDVVLINCLGFTYHQVRKFDKASRLQHMLFSFKVLPFSLFFNAGPRLHAERNHRNRWVPTEVSRHLLKGSSTFDLPPKSVSKYSDEGMRLKLSLDQDVDKTICGKYMLICPQLTNSIHQVAVRHALS
ncbi:hypothetical protein PRZ48_015206 [Zasmidium cellare]|uniref:Heterokaryon incompatibility domain-containing protein n=1 Tax=Zasmidium cellare TaxID=395010 RepID=A0ABR0DYE3_ZASCE|nr:hypothetical protein PRZ48_015206 [Zasmidium cellare]